MTPRKPKAYTDRQIKAILKALDLSIQATAIYRMLRHWSLAEAIAGEPYIEQCAKAHLIARDLERLQRRWEAVR